MQVNNPSGDGVVSDLITVIDKDEEEIKPGFQIIFLLNEGNDKSANFMRLSNTHLDQETQNYLLYYHGFKDNFFNPGGHNIFNQ